MNKYEFKWFAKSLFATELLIAHGEGCQRTCPGDHCCYKSVRWLGGDTEYPLAGMPILLVLGDYSLWTSEDAGEKQIYYSQSRMASDDVGSSLSRFMIVPNTKRHPHNTKTDQLPISEVTTGLPRPYHNISRICLCEYNGRDGTGILVKITWDVKDKNIFWTGAILCRHCG